MAKYRVPELDLATRIEIAYEMMQPAASRGWGWVTEQAQMYGVLRQFLYDLRDGALRLLHDRAEAALAVGLQANAPGPVPFTRELLVDQEYLRRSIAEPSGSLATVSGSVRGIQMGLELLFGVQRSVGFIRQTLQQAGEAASAQNQAVVASTPVLAEADEIFHGRQPCLTVVDGHSFLVLNLTPVEKRDADS